MSSVARFFIFPAIFLMGISPVWGQITIMGTESPKLYFDEKEDLGYSPFIVREREKMPNLEVDSKKDFHAPVAGMSDEEKTKSAELMQRKLSERTKLRDFGQVPSGVDFSERNYFEEDYVSLLERTRKAGTKSLGATLFKDTFEYKNSRNNFNDIFRNTGDGKDSDLAIMLILSGVSYWYRNYFEIGWGMNFGAGYNGGRGFFDQSDSDGGTQSREAYFRLWTFPVDLFLTTDLTISRFLKISVMGGPSFLGIYQYRGDVENGSDKKEMRQYSFGYYAGAKIHIPLSEIFSSAAQDYFNNYSVTRFFLTAEMRLHEYTQFKSEGLKVSGQSFGLGMTFEYF